MGFIPVPTRTVLNIEIVFREARPEEVLRGAVEALRINSYEDRDVILRPILSGSLASGFKVDEVEALEDRIVDSVNALYVGKPKIVFER